MHKQHFIIGVKKRFLKWYSVLISAQVKSSGWTTQNIILDVCMNVQIHTLQFAHCAMVDNDTLKS